MNNKIINGYTIKHLIGSGGMADVYYAENKLGKKAAIKVLKSELCAIGSIKERFEQEARIMVNLEHKHIRQAYDLDEVNGQPAIIMEYLEGQTLKQLIDKGKISDEKAKKYFEQCVTALRVAHTKEIVHRDIKPSNIFITLDDEVKIMDFGIAKVAESGLGTRTNQMLGTPVYMSPEQIKSPKNVGTKSDVYSLAVTFYHLLTGKVPYDSTTDSDFEILSKIVHEDLDLSRVSTLWGTIMKPMLIKDSNQRIAINYLEIDKIKDDNTQFETIISLPVPEHKQTINSKPIKQTALMPSLKWRYIIFGFLLISISLVLTLRSCQDNIVRPKIEMVSIPWKNFKLSKYEVTVGQYLEFCKATGKHWPEWLEEGHENNIYSGSTEIYKNAGMSENNLNHPIIGVSAQDADAFCKWMGGRLPTETEWEQAAKGTYVHTYAGNNDIRQIAWYKSNSNGKVHPVGQKSSSGYGLSDMTGNVWECTSTMIGADRIVKGGSWSSEASECATVESKVLPVKRRYDNVGFRLALPR